MMNRLTAAIQRFWRQSILVFFIGFIVTSAIQVVLEQPASKYIQVLTVMVVFYTAYSLITISLTRHAVNTQLDQIGLLSFWMTEQNESNEGFIKSRDVVLSAQNSILVLSHYIPENSEIEFSETRKSYLIDGIEQVIKSRLAQPEAPAITYRRIIQTNDAMRNGTLTEQMMKGDPQTFEHCKRIFDTLTGKMYNNVYVDFRVSNPIPSFPNMLVVDNRYILFALSTRAPRLATPQHKYINVGVFLIEDRHGKTIQGFINVFNRFFESSHPIAEVVSISQTDA